MNCIVCKNSRKEKMFKGLVRCEGCGLVYYDNKLEKTDLKNLYQEKYFSGEEYYDYKKDKATIQRNFQHRLRDMNRYVKKGDLFEIGCAHGFFLEVAKEFFSVSGIDIAEEPTNFARKNLRLDAATGNYPDLKVGKKRDVFCMWDTIEHLEKPDAFIEKISLELNSGGYLFLTTGDIASLVAKTRGPKWRMIHPPTHLYYFCPDTISKLLKNYGFEVIKITHPGIFRSLRQILYSLLFLDKKGFKKLKKMFSKINIPIYINTFDIMMVTARKK